jgi:hypothetical protein
VKPPNSAKTQPTTAELRDLAEVARGLEDARRSRIRTRLFGLFGLLVIAFGLWSTRVHWLPYVVTSDPYAATPAASFPVGAAGIVPPPPTAVPGMSVERVRDALDRVKQALQASYLDDRLWDNGDPAGLLGLLAPDSATVVRSMFDQGGYGTAIVRFAPGTRLTAPPRVNGKITFSQVNWRGMPALDVATNYVWAYALRSTSGDSDVVVIHSSTNWMFPLGKNLLPSSRGMYLGRTSGYWQGMDCAASMRGLTAPAPAHDRNANPNFSDPDPDAYFDANRSVQVVPGCR